MAWLGEVPGHWGVRRIKYVAPLRNIKILAGESDLSYIGLENIESWSGRYVVQDESNDSEGLSSRFFSSDVLFGKLRPYLAKAFLSNFEGICSSEFLVLQVKGIQSHFLVRFVLSVGFIKEVDSSTYGAKMPRASWEFIGNLPITFPPTEEQSTIATFLDKETTQIDQLIEKKTRFIELLKEKRAALITEAVTGKFDVRTGKPYAAYKDSGVEWLGEVPTHWEALPIKRLTPVQRGASPRPIDDPIYFDENGEFSWVRIADVSSSTGVLTKTKQRLSSLGSSLSVKMYPGSLFLSIAGTVGKPCITKIKCCIHDGFVYFPGLRISNMFLYWVFESGRCYAGLGKMGTQLNLNTETVGGIAIALPGKQDIASILSYLYKKTTKIDQLIEKTQQSISLLKEKRAALITAAVTGKIDVRDFNPKR